MNRKLFLISLSLYLTSLIVLVTQRPQQRDDSNVTVTTVSTSEAEPELSLFLNETNSIFTSEGTKQINETFSNHIDDWVVTFVDATYFDTFELWYRYYRRLEPQRRGLFIVALGESTYDKLKASSCLYYNHIMTNSSVIVSFVSPKMTDDGEIEIYALWQQRIQLLYELLHQFPMFNFFFTDVDAFWRKEPNDFIATSLALRDADVIASRGIYPPQCHLTLEGAACMGFIRFRNSPATRDYVARVREYNTKEKDDQNAVNCVLKNTLYEQVGQEMLPFSSNKDDKTSLMTFRHPESSSVEIPNLQVVVLSYNIVIRYCDENADMLNDAFVVHCHSKKNGTSKASAIEKFNLSIPGEDNHSSCFK